MHNTKYPQKIVWKRQNTFPLDTIIDVIAKKGNEIKVKSMRYGKALQLPKTKGWVYEYFEIGYHSYKNT